MEEGASNKFSFAMRGIFLVSLLLVLCSEPSSGQFLSGIMECPQKIRETCSGLRMDPLPTDPESSRLRVTCCSSAAVTRCIRRQAAQHCPSTPVDSLLNLIQTVSNTACTGYDFWSPECLYTNFMIEILGAGAATGVILLLLIILCCCCCRSKK